MATLFNTKISQTYEGLIKTFDNAAITATLKELTDGSGNQSGLYMNTAGDFKVTNILEWGSLKDTGTGVTITRFVTSTDGIENFDNNTSLPTSAAVKLYVDTKFATSDTLEEVLSFGNTTSGNDIAVSSGDDITFTDTSKILMGASSDLQIYHDGSNSYIKDVGTGSLILTANEFYVYDSGGVEPKISAITNGAVNLYYDATKRFETTTDGSKVTGNLVVTGTITGSGGSFLPLAGGTMTGNIVLNDNVKSIYGTASDGLEIYHDSSNSYIRDTGTGNLFIDSSNLYVRVNTNEFAIKAFANSRVELYYDNSKKFETTNTGAKVTGFIQVTNGVDVTGGNIDMLDNSRIRIGTSQDLQIYHNGSHSYIQDTGTGELRVTASTFSLRDSGDTELLMTAYENGAVNLYFDGTKRIETLTDGAKVTGNLEVTGTITGSGGSFLPLAGGDMTGSTTHGDSVYSYWGNSNDLQIGHDGSNSYIIDRGSGDLLLYYSDDFVVSKQGTSEVSIRANQDSSVELFFDNVQKLATTSTGISVTGNGVFTGNVGVPDSAFLYAGTSDDLSLTHNGTDSIIKNYTGDFYINQGAVTQSIIFKVSNNFADDTTALTISRNGDLTTGRDVTIAGDLTVNGTTTTVNSQTLAVVDPLIQLAKDNTGNSLDIGLYGDYNDGTDRFLGLFSDASDSNKFKLFKGLTVEPTTTVNIGATGYVAADLEVAGLESSSFISTGTVSATSFISTTDAGIDINGLTLTRVAANTAIRTSGGLETLGLLRSYAGLAVGTTGTFGGAVSTNGYLYVQGQATPQIFMVSNTAGTPSWTMIARNDGYFLIGRSGVSNDFYITPTGNANFSGNVDLNGAGDPILDIYRDSGANHSIRLHSEGTSWIDNNNNFGIGTNNPGAKFEVVSAGAAGKARINSDGNGAVWTSNGDMQFYTNNTAYATKFYSANKAATLVTIADSGETTFTGNVITGINLKVNGNNQDATLNLSCNTGNWSFINQQSSRNLLLTDSDGTGTVMTIDTLGKVGIGLAPTNKLHVKDETPYGGITIQGNNAPAITFDDTSDTAISQIYAQNGGILRLVADKNNVVAGSSLELHVDGTERFRIFENGNIQMGNVTTISNPQSWGQLFQIRNAGGNGAAISLTDSNNEWNLATYGGQFTISTATTEVVSIDNAGEVGINVNNPLFELCIGAGDTPNRNQMEFAVSSTDAGTNILQNYNRATAAYTPMNLAAKFLTIGTGTGATQRILLDDAGKFGLSGSNTITAPTYLMQVNMQAEGSPLNYLNGTAINFGNNGFAAIHSNPAANNTIEAGLRLQNNNNDIGAYSPLIAFSARSSSNTYNHTYAAIYGVHTSGGADTNWTRGDIVFSTSSGTGPNEKMRLTKDGNLIVGGTTVAGANLDVAAATNPTIRLTNTTDPLGNATVGTFEFFTNDSSTGASRVVSSIVCDNQAGSAVPEGALVFKTAVGGGSGAAATERMRIKANGDIALTGNIVDQDGVRTFTKGGTMLNAQAYTFDISVPADVGGGTVHHVTAMMTHYQETYGCVLDCYAYTRGTTVAPQTNLVNQTSTGGGAWTVTKPDSTTLRITKTAGTYAGSGFFQLVVVTKTP